MHALPTLVCVRACLILAALVAVSCSAVGCGATASEQHSCAPLPAPRVAPVALPHLLLITIDGVRAQDIFASDGRTRLPNLYRLIDRGVALGSDASPVYASGPRFVSLPGYREILTGRRGTRACVDNECGPLDEPTLLDELRLRGGLDGGDVVVLASWPVIARAAALTPAAITLLVGRHGGVSRSRLSCDPAVAAALAAGRQAGAFPGHGDYRPDAATAALATALVQAGQPRVLWIALGDTDEYAHRGDWQGYLAALAAADALLGRLARLGLADDTLILVTADHGRSANFRDHGDSLESSRSWLIAAGGAIPPVGIVRDGDAHRLADIAPSLRALVHLDHDPSSRAGEPIPAMISNHSVSNDSVSVNSVSAHSLSSHSVSSRSFSFLDPLQ
jgi:hypothetical protein